MVLKGLFSSPESKKPGTPSRNATKTPFLTCAVVWSKAELGINIPSPGTLAIRLVQ